MTDCKSVHNSPSYCKSKERWLVVVSKDGMLKSHEFHDPNITVYTHLNVTKRLFRDKADGDREEIVCVTSNAEFHRAGLVGCTNDRQTPFQDVLTTVMPVISFTVTYDWSTDAGPNIRHAVQQHHQLINQSVSIIQMWLNQQYKQLYSSVWWDSTKMQHISQETQ